MCCYTTLRKLTFNEAASCNALQHRFAKKRYYATLRLTCAQRSVVWKRLVFAQSVVVQRILCSVVSDVVKYEVPVWTLTWVVIAG